MLVREADLYVNDYNLLTKKYLENNLLKYTSFLFSNKLNDIVSTESFHQQNLELSTENWEWFKLHTVGFADFEITGSTTTSVLELEEYGEGPYPYISSNE